MIKKGQKHQFIQQDENYKNADFGGIELIFSFLEPTIKKTEFKLVNYNHGLVLPYYFKRKIQFKNKLTIVIFIKNAPIQTVTFIEGIKYGNIKNVGEKDLRDFVIAAKIDYDNEVLFLKWNKKQKSKSTLLLVKYESEEV